MVLKPADPRTDLVGSIMKDAEGSSYPEPQQGDFVVKNYLFQDGNQLPELKIYYRTLGMPKKDEKGFTSNAVLIMHGTTGSSEHFFSSNFAGVLFNPGQLLSAEEYFLILPDGIGHGQSSKPSDGLHNSFPRYGYLDMVRAQKMLLTEHLEVNHLRLVMGTSMGGMHTWVWGTTYPDFMDALMPLASLPCQISGRNRMIRKHAIESIRECPGFHGGNYEVQPPGLKVALNVLMWMATSPLQLQKAAPDWESADKLHDSIIGGYLREKDANDVAYAYDASWDYDPRPHLRKIKCPLTAVNSADDQVNPPELGILEEETKNVPNARAVVLPITDQTIGHGTHSLPSVWGRYLAELLARSKRETV